MKRSRGRRVEVRRNAHVFHLRNGIVRLLRGISSFEDRTPGTGRYGQVE
jgi:hypothetical protein